MKTRILVGTGIVSVDKMKCLINPTTHEIVMQLEDEGYVFLPAFLPLDKCRACEQELIDFLASRKLVSSNSLMIPPNFQAKIKSNENCPTITTKSPCVMENQEWIATNDAINNYISHPKLAKLLESIIIEKFGKCFVSQVPFKWMRAVGTGLFTGVHCDYTYVSHISKIQLTAWIPISNISLENGSLVVSPGSHVKNTYINTVRLGDDGTNSGWITTDPNQIKEDFSTWVSEDFKQGDVVILDLKVIHATATNITNTWRLSCDTRFVGLGL